MFPTADVQPRDGHLHRRRFQQRPDASPLIHHVGPATFTDFRIRDGSAAEISLKPLGIGGEGEDLGAQLK
jgi:hypothetical protein